MVRAERDTLFVFGDNLQREGYGGQAREMRGEPNAVGIVTKRAPNMKATAFLRDTDADPWRMANLGAFKRLREYKGLIVWPSDGIGTGRARMAVSAPTLWNELEQFRIELTGLAGVQKNDEPPPERANGSVADEDGDAQPSPPSLWSNP